MIGSSTVAFRATHSSTDQEGGSEFGEFRRGCPALLNRGATPSLIDRLQEFLLLKQPKIDGMVGFEKPLPAEESLQKFRLGVGRATVGGFAICE